MASKQSFESATYRMSIPPAYPQAAVQAQHTGFSSNYEQNLNEELRGFGDPNAHGAPVQAFDHIQDPPHPPRSQRLSKKVRNLIIVTCILLSVAAVAIIVGVLVSRGHNQSGGSGTVIVTAPVTPPKSTSTKFVTITTTEPSTQSTPDPSTFHFSYEPKTSVAITTATIEQRTTTVNTVTEVTTASLPSWVIAESEALESSIQAVVGSISTHLTAVSVAHTILGHPFEKSLVSMYTPPPSASASSPTVWTSRPASLVCAGAACYEPPGYSAGAR